MAKISPYSALTLTLALALPKKNPHSCNPNPKPNPCPDSQPISALTYDFILIGPMLSHNPSPALTLKPTKPKPIPCLMLTPNLNFSSIFT